MRTRSKLALVAGALTLLGVGALGWSRVASRADARAGASDQHAAEGSATRDAPCGDATDCGRLLKTVEADIAFRTARAAGRDDAWLEWKTIALDHLERAHLTGDPSAYAAAQRALDTAFEQSPPGSGPFLARARMNFTLHRFDAVEPDLVRAERAVLVHAKTRARIALFRADVLYNLQRYDEADAAYRELLKGPPTIGLLASAAQAARRTGDFRRGEALLEQAGALAGPRGEARAWVELQLGAVAVERGDLRAARAHYLAADRAFSGWYLVHDELASLRGGAASR
ncbi:MAG: hypothetical protein KC543_08335 [Myxococcales bacterium]|nr:hypothetical protein [Myxococcales bacterium]